MYRLFNITIFALMLFTSCVTQYDGSGLKPQSADARSQEIVDKSIAVCGGMEHWQKMKAMSYNKDFQLLDEDGNIEKEFRQIHTYKYNPSHIHIQSIENGDTIITEYVNQKYRRTINGRIVDVSQESLAKNVNTSTYVIGIPFKLLDPGTILKYEGEETLENSTKVNVVSASYNADENENHSTTDFWKYYFDKTDNRVVGNWVQVSDHFSLLENLTFIKAGGILFNGKRESYRVDETGNKLFLRAAYNYYNYKVKY